MEKFKRFLNKIPTAQLAIIAIMFALVPFQPPHLVEKVLMLFAGELVKPLDIFDLFMHGTPLALLILKLTWAKPESTTEG